MANIAESSSSRQPSWPHLQTAALIGSWGKRYLDLNRESLKATDWQDVANIVNFLSPWRDWTVAQCKSRVNELWDIFQSERAKIQRSNGVYTSSWIFYKNVEPLFTPPVMRKRKSSSGGLSCLAEAIRGFGAVYEKVETEKVDNMIEMEKRRMAFAKEMEEKRKQMMLAMLEEYRPKKRVKRLSADVTGMPLVTLEESLNREGRGSESGTAIERCSGSDSDMHISP